MSSARSRLIGRYWYRQAGKFITRCISMVRTEDYRNSGNMPYFCLNNTIIVEMSPRCRPGRLHSDEDATEMVITCPRTTLRPAGFINLVFGPKSLLPFWRKIEDILSSLTAAKVQE